MPVPKEKHSKILCVDDLRHAEYYQMQKSFDELYSKSKNNEIFTDLMELILTRENILLAYRNIDIIRNFSASKSKSNQRERNIVETDM